MFNQEQAGKIRLEVNLDEIATKLASINFEKMKTQGEVDGAIATLITDLYGQEMPIEKQPYIWWDDYNTSEGTPHFHISIKKNNAFEDIDFGTYEGTNGSGYSISIDREVLKNALITYFSRLQ